MNESALDGLERMRDYLTTDLLVSDEAVTMVEYINGVNETTYYDILYVAAGERMFPWEYEG